MKIVELLNHFPKIDLLLSNVHRKADYDKYILFDSTSSGSYLITVHCSSSLLILIVQYHLHSNSLHTIHLYLPFLFRKAFVSRCYICMYIYISTFYIVFHTLDAKLLFNVLLAIRKEKHWILVCWKNPKKFPPIRHARNLNPNPNQLFSNSDSIHL